MKACAAPHLQCLLWSMQQSLNPTLNVFKLLLVLYIFRWTDTVTYFFLTKAKISHFVICLSVSTCTVIGQFFRPYSTVQPAKFKSLIDIFLPSYLLKKILKLKKFVTEQRKNWKTHRSSMCAKFNTWGNWLSTWLQLISFPTHLINPRDTINIVPHFLGPYCKLQILVFSRWFMTCMLCTWAINQGEKLGPCNLQYGLCTWLVRLTIMQRLSLIFLANDTHQTTGFCFSQ